MSSTETEVALPGTRTTSQAGATAAPVDTEWSMPAAAPARPGRRVGLIVAAVIGIGAVGAGGYLAWQQYGKRDTGQDIQLYEVVRRSFPIIIAEKGELKATNSVDVQSEVEGHATIISLVDEGTHVKTGDLLVELASDEIEEKIKDLEIRESVADAAHKKAVTDLEILKDKNESDKRKAKLALEMAKIGQKKYEEGDAFELEQDANIAFEQAQFELKRVEKYLKDSEELFKQGFITQIERDDDEFTAYKAENELTKAKIARDVLKKYEIPMNRTEKQSDIDEAGAELLRTEKAAKASEEQACAEVKAKEDELALVRDKLTRARKQKEKARIVAPAEGLVVYKLEHHWDEGSRIKTGARVHERQTLIELPDTSSMKVVIKVHEAQIERLEEGLAATITVEGFAGRQFTGKVTKIAVLADSGDRWLNRDLKQFETEVQLDGDASGLKPGGTARVQIKITELNDVIAVPVQAVFGKGGKYYVFVDNNREPVEVEVGESSNEYIEITKGLEVEQKVLMAITEEMKLDLPEDKAEGEENGGDREKRGGGKGRRAG